MFINSDVEPVVIFFNGIRNIDFKIHCTFGEEGLYECYNDIIINMFCPFFRL